MAMVRADGGSLSLLADSQPNSVIFVLIYSLVLVLRIFLVLVSF